MTAGLARDWDCSRALDAESAGSGAPSKRPLLSNAEEDADAEAAPSSSAADDCMRWLCAEAAAVAMGAEEAASARTPSGAVAALNETDRRRTEEAYEIGSAAFSFGSSPLPPPAAAVSCSDPWRACAAWIALPCATDRDLSLGEAPPGLASGGRREAEKEEEDEE